MSTLADSLHLRVATRISPLARVQTDAVVARLSEAIPGLKVDILPMSTQGDERLSWSLEARGGKGLFTKELEHAILEGHADLAVHSAKDMPTEMPPGLALAGYLPRVDPADVLVMREGCALPERIATGSPRRRAQAALLFPNATFCEIRGRVETRLQKIVDGHADATFLAAAGLARLGIDRFAGLIFRFMTLDEMVPAAGQAAIALQCREADVPFFAPHLCPDTAAVVDAERLLLASMGGGCHSAVAAHVTGNRVYIFKESSGRREYRLEQPLTAHQLEAIAAEITS